MINYIHALNVLSRQNGKLTNEAQSIVPLYVLRASLPQTYPNRWGVRHLIHRQSGAGQSEDDLVEDIAKTSSSRCSSSGVLLLVGRAGSVG